MTRCYGGAPRGQRVHDAVPKNFGRNISIFGALTWHGMNAVKAVEGAVDTEVFRAYVRYVLVPTLRTGDVAVMDNLSVHKAPDIELLIVQAVARLIYLSEVVMPFTDLNAALDMPEGTLFPAAWGGPSISLSPRLENSHFGEV